MISRTRTAALCVGRRLLSTGPEASPAKSPVFDLAFDELHTETANDTEKPRFARRERTWVKLSGLPRTISPADIAKHVTALTLSNPKQVHLDYRNFIPSGRAWVGFTNPEKTEQALQVLRDSVIAGHTIRAQKTDEQNLVDAGLPPRTRGFRGRAEAQERGLASGNGPDAKLINRQKNVYMWGLPGRTLGPELVKLLDPYGLRVTAEEPRPIQKLERKAPTSRFVVRLTTIAGAHRLVRDFHMTEKFGAGYLVHARVVY
ncbi:unnamed protein product [Rhizoctonia solani]|uniref:RRM domain-containing protein n=1 Tax=Rhizoctonia solani TaxID=456999 RepID=A0A8H2XXM3_9AGAM|nr:unnamed protein product [Rhizoctonia solani]CAE6460354.1 unnamed protein product [Rhizoctonia solani]